MKRAVVLLALVAASSAFAANEYRYMKSGDYLKADGAWVASAQSACAAAASAYKAARTDGYPPSIDPVVNGTTCALQYQGSTIENVPIEVRTQQGCSAQAGKTSIKNWTVGYTRTPDDNDYAAVGPVNKLPGTGNPVCFDGCTGNQPEPTAPGWRAWKSQTPTSQGLYRNSLDVPFQMTGQACTAGAANTTATSPTVVNPTCPGYVGDVNGKKGCYGTASAPIISEPITPPISKPPEAANPPAGDVPAGAASTGSGRTPSTGDGGAGGGPSAAAVGGKGGDAGGTTSGTGTVKTPASGEQQANCGAPGQPVCDVKINEGEMPAEGTTFKDANQKLDDNVKATGDHIKSIQNEESKPSWSFSFQLPTGCSPYQVASFKGTAFTMDPCAYQSTIHDLMSMVWAAATAFCLIGMVGRTLRST